MQDGTRNDARKSDDKMFCPRLGTAMKKIDINGPNQLGIKLCELKDINTKRTLFLFGNKNSNN